MLRACVRGLVAAYNIVHGVSSWSQATGRSSRPSVILCTGSDLSQQSWPIADNRDQFVGGDTVADCIPVIHQLRNEFKGSLLAYSVEVDKTKPGDAGSALHTQMVEEMIRSIDTAADYEDTISTSAERSTWVAIKLVRSSAVSPYPMLTLDHPDGPPSRFPSIGSALPAFSSIETLFLYTISRKSNTPRLGYPQSIRGLSNPVIC